VICEDDLDNGGIENICCTVAVRQWFSSFSISGGLRRIAIGIIV
jgi:hypothetical protein